MGEGYDSGIEAHTAPPAISGDYARVFHRSKGEWLASAQDGLPQAAGALLSPTPIPWPEAHVVGLGSIDMFTMSPAGEVAPAGVDADIADAWMPAVQALAAAVIEALADLDVVLDGDGYITASANEAIDVSHEPHFDDDMYSADEGIGLVAIVGQLGGPRLATGSLPMDVRVAGSPTQLPLDPELEQRFEDDELPMQITEAERIVLFPGFLQLHSGPKLPADCEDSRLLLVLRAQTVPTT